MSIVDYVDTSVSGEGSVPTIQCPLHRLATVCRQQGIPRRTVARCMNAGLAGSHSQFRPFRAYDRMRGDRTCDPDVGSNSTGEEMVIRKCRT